MAARKISEKGESPSSARPRNLPRGESRKLVTDDGRRNRFKVRGKDLERGISAPSLLSKGEDSPGTPKAPMPLNESEVITVGLGLGHDFAKKTFFQPTYCHYCSELLWGLKGQGYMCKVCNYICHEKCIPYMSTPCRHILADSIQDPVAHVWTSPIQLKKKAFCNVCRKKISNEGVICEVCKVYSHVYCKDQAFSNCKHIASYSYGAPVENVHHWIEGNLPSSARCQVCTKNCCSTDCLTGFRCGWCGIEVHTRCMDKHQTFNPTCDFRDLWGMILLPKAISHRNVLDPDSLLVTPTSADVVSPTDVLQGEDADETDGNGGKGKPCIVIDGSSQKGFKKWRKTTVHPTNLTKDMTAQELLVISLKKCGISDAPDDYYLVDVQDKEETELLCDDNPYNLPPKSHGILRLYIRHRSVHKTEEKKEEEEAKGKIRVNNGHLASAVDHVTLLVTSKTTAKEIVEQSLVKFDLVEESSADYCLVELSQLVGVTEKILADTDTPWKKVQDMRRDSLTMSNRQRYFVRHRKGGKTSIYLGGIAKETLKSEDKYTAYIKDLISSEDLKAMLDKVEVGPAFPSLGGLVLTFPTFELAVRLTQAMEQNPAKPMIVLLPTIYSEMTAKDQEPVLIFINGKSGGNQGVELLSAFRRHLNPHQVWDLTKGGPIPGLWSMRNLEQFRILIGGGDGTFGWVLGALQEVKNLLRCRDPPSALLPLGTGNDLARALKWGGGYSGEKVMQVLRSLEDANTVKLDRWSVSFKEQQMPKEEKITSHGPSSVVMNNYAGIGLDAAIALDFHLAREENPEKFSSRLHNKGFYLQLGLQKMVHKTETRELRRHIALTVDGKRVPLPDIAGLIILNIQSWGAGADPWGTASDPAYKPAAYDDGLLEVVGIKGVMQMGQVQSGIRNAVRIAQGSELSLDLLSPLPVQVDGEAWAQPSGTMAITKLPDQATLLESGTRPSSHSRQTSKKEITLLHSVSNSEILYHSEGLSTRRKVSSDHALLTQEKSIMEESSITEEEPDEGSSETTQTTEEQ